MKILQIKHQWKVSYTENGSSITHWLRTHYEAVKLRRELGAKGIVPKIEYVKTEYYEPKVSIVKL